MIRFAAVKEVASFGSLHQSFASLLYVIMLSNWPMFMDAAGDVKDVLMARLFFYSFKVFWWSVLESCRLFLLFAVFGFMRELPLDISGLMTAAVGS